MEDSPQMFDDDSMVDTPMDEDFFDDPDETLVDMPDISDLNKEAEHGSLGTEDDGDGDYEDEEELQAPGDQTGVPKAEWSEDMIQTEEMAKLGICVNVPAKVVVCLACSSAVKPSDLHRHLIRTHAPMSTTPAYCQELTDTYSLLEDPARSRPGTIIRAIFGLDLVNGLLACNACGYACKGEKWIKVHVKQTGTSCSSYSQRYAQTFRPTSSRMYFGVTLSPEVPPEDPLDPVAILKRKFGPPPFSNVPITSPKTPRDANRFLKIEKWEGFVEGKTGAELEDLTRERCPEVRSELRVCVERYALDIIPKLHKAGNEAMATLGDFIG